MSPDMLLPNALPRPYLNVVILFPSLEPFWNVAVRAKWLLLPSAALLQ